MSAGRVMRDTGRALSDTARLTHFKRWLATQPTPKPLTSHTYRGFQISGRGSKWWIETGNDPRVFKSKAQAQDAVDRCIAVRALMSI